MQLYSASRLESKKKFHHKNSKAITQSEQEIWMKSMGNTDSAPPNS